MQNNDPVVIVSMSRTPMGAFQGELSGFSATELGSAAIAETLKRGGLKADDVDDVIMGCVLPAGLGQAPARQASIGAGLPDSAGATTVNKVCGSGMRAVMIAHDQILAGATNITIAGGMESMTNAPYLLDKARGGYRMGHAKVYDHMFLDGLEDAYDKGQAMGVFADDTARKLQITREEQDKFALASLERATRAIREGDFKAEIVPVTVKSKKGDTVIADDEGPSRARPEKIPQLKPAFTPDGTVTAATSSSISDGAAALLLMRKSEAEKRGLKIIAAIRAHATHAQKPAEFTLAPIAATRKVVEKAGWNLKDVELFEINEAFAVVTLAAMRELSLPHEKVNVNGGACALGHPIGCSGARIIVTLLGAMQKRGLKKGVASLCIGGGEATAVALERAA
ncbi:MAG: acetyl-CoA C-acyltransferase [Alphaproteobacteria bacterium]|nr:acetyl-CoA C-acyltransferase [Alphaproteobacteria bacterium]MDE2336817.1 acetyl-CoA C-acyltransferase [Alphaproteobacteria bacterium]